MMRNKFFPTIIFLLAIVQVVSATLGETIEPLPHGHHHVRKYARHPHHHRNVHCMRKKHRNVPTFLGLVQPNARIEYFQILHNNNLKQEEKGQKLFEWARANGVEISGRGRCLRYNFLNKI